MGEPGQDPPRQRVSLTRIEEALAVIDPVFLNSPQIEFDTLSSDLGANVVLKIETLNPIRSFKGRGGCFVVYHQAENAHLVVASAGNFGQGVAYAAGRRGLPLTVFAATNANPLKVARMRELGAEVALAGNDFDEAKAAANLHAKQTGSVLIEDGRDAAVSEGAGTLAVELLRGPGPLDAIVVPLGNGAMINGIATWTKAHSPRTQVIGTCATGAPSMERSWRTGKVESTPTADTIADGIAVRIPVPEAVADMQDIVDDVVLVSDQAILAAMRLILDRTGILVEPSGAVGVATLQTYTSRFAGGRVATILCGGNVTMEQFQAWFCGGG